MTTGSGTTTYRVTKEEYLQAIRLHLKKQIVVVGVLVALLLLQFVVFQALSRRCSSGIGYSFPILLLLLLALPVAVVRRKFAKNYEQSVRLVGDVTLSFDDAGFEMVTARSRSRLAGADIVKVKENRELLLLYMTDLQFVVIPKRVFGSAESLEAFRALFPAIRPR